MFDLIYLHMIIIKNNKTMMISAVRRLAMTLLHEEVIIASWGITKVEIEDTNLCFYVNGLKYSGPVKICVLNSGDYEVYFGEESHGIQGIETIVSFLDNTIEMTDSYNKDLECWINKRTSLQ